MSLHSTDIHALYVHVPFCATKCDYCVFHSLPGAPPEQHDAYLLRLEHEFSETAFRCGALDSVFIGGGTPTVLSPDRLARLFAAVHRHFHLAGDAEFTVECNPEGVTEHHAEVLAEAGVNRASLGVQSFAPRLREMLGRHGMVASIPAAVENLLHCGIRNFNCDLIYAIPGQSLADWRADLLQAASLGASHVSTYALTIEEGSKLADDGCSACNDETTAQMWELAGDLLAEADLRRYEISNFARAGLECRHNLSVWHGGHYLGCGPAASSFDGRTRWTNAWLTQWLEGAPPKLDELPPEARAAEILAFGLRTVAGWSRLQFRQRTGFDAGQLRGGELACLESQGLVDLSNDRIRPTTKGLLFGDTVAMELL